MSEAEGRVAGGRRNGRDWLRAPAAPDSKQAIARYVDAVRRHFPSVRPEFYGVQDGIAGPRAQDGELDLAIVFADEGWSEAKRVAELSEIAFDVMLECGTHIHGWPIPDAVWREPGQDDRVAAMKRRAYRVD